MMNAALVFDECDRDKNEYHEEHNALFAFRELEDPEGAFHLIGRVSCAACHVERSETSLAYGIKSEILRFAQNDKVSYLHFFV
jgi:hypothetical protein